MTWRPCRLAEPPRGAWTIALLVVFFLVTTVLTRMLCCDAEGRASFWPPNAAMLAALLTLRARGAIIVIGGCVAGYLCLAPPDAWPPGEAVLANGLNVFQVLVAAPLTRRYCGATTDLLRLRRFTVFSGIAVLASALEAALGVTAMNHFKMGAELPFKEWVQWVICDSLGLILATPVAIRLVRGSCQPASALRLTGKTCGVLAIGFVMAAASVIWPDTAIFVFVFPAFALLAFQAETFWVGLSVCIVAVFMSALTTRGFGPFAHLTSGDDLMRQAMLQPYLIALALVVLPINNAMADRRRAERRLQAVRTQLVHRATYDDLTGLTNRRMFGVTLRAALNKGHGAAVMLMDVDDFKTINDTFGHAAGDALLSAFAQRLRDGIAPWQGLASRLGGDEFAVLLSGRRTEEELGAIARTLLAAFREPYDLGPSRRRVTLSIGAALADPARRQTDDEVVAQADSALYVCKHLGRNGYNIYRPGPVVPRHDAVAHVPSCHGSDFRAVMMAGPG